MGKMVTTGIVSAIILSGVAAGTVVDSIAQDTSVGVAVGKMKTNTLRPTNILLPASHTLTPTFFGMTTPMTTPLGGSAGKAK